jgi:hypothetical protein
VRFAYTDHATGEGRDCTLTAGEFMRRYLQHVLPTGVHRVRYFGWLHPAAKRRRLTVETLLAVVIVVRPSCEVPPSEPRRCPHCQGFTLVRVGSLARAPPGCTS